MSRYILCPKCKDKLKLVEEDIAMGLSERRVEIPQSKKPRHLSTSIITMENGEAKIEKRSVPHLRCDCCSDVIPNGTTVMAATHWRGDEPPAWEREYGGA